MKIIVRFIVFENLEQSTCTNIPKENDLLNDYEAEKIDNDEYDDDEYENSSNDGKLITSSFTDCS